MSNPKDFSEFENFKTKADKGDKIAQFNVGLYYQKGKGVQKSETDALKYFTLSADQGYLEACKELFSVYYKGRLGVEKSDEKALKYLQILADSGDPAYINDLGFFYAKGLGGLEHSDVEAFSYYKMAAEKRSPTALFNVGIFYQNGMGVQKSESDALKFFTLSADQGCLEACKELYYVYHYGTLGVKKSDEKALKYLQILADSGDSAFINDLGYFHSKGLGGIEKSPQQAFYYFKQAADKGNGTAQLNVGCFYERGMGTKKSFKEAIKYYTLSANQGNLKAVRELFKAYHEGKLGVIKSDEKALEYLKILVDAKEPLFLNRLGFFYENGLGGLEKSDEKANEYYHLAAELGNSKELYQMGITHRRKSFRYPGSVHWAVQFFKLAADKGSLEAIKTLHKNYQNHLYDEEEHKYLEIGSKCRDSYCLYTLAKYFSEGSKNFPQSFRQAFIYFKLAALAGHIHSKFIMDEMFKIIHPHAQSVELEAYFSDGKLKTLDKILKDYGKKPIFLSNYAFSPEEAPIICEAMIYNSHFTVICSKENFSTLCDAFEQRGYSSQDLDKIPIKKICRKENLIGYNFIPYHGNSLSKNEKVIKLLSGNLVDPESNFYISSFHLSEKEENLEELSKKGNPEALFFLSLMHLNGNLERSPKLAFEYMKLAADMGMPEAQYNLSIYYYEGIGVKKSKSDALCYSQLAVEQNLIPAMYLLGNKLSLLIGKDLAQYYLQKAADQDYIPALIALGLEKIHNKPHDAFSYFSRAFEQEDVEFFYDKEKLKNLIKNCLIEIKVVEYSQKANEMHKYLDKNVVYYIPAEQIDLDRCPSKDRFNLLINTFQNMKDSPIHILGTDFSFNEENLIRDAMLENPLITIICPRSAGYGIEEAFYRKGYRGSLRSKKLHKKDKESWYGYLFIGKEDD